MVHLVLSDLFDRAYELTDRCSAPQSSSAVRHRYDACFTFSLVTRLPVTPFQWLQILQGSQCHLPNFYSNHPAEVYQAVTESVMRGDLVIYQLPRITDFGALSGRKGFGLSIIKGPNPHCATRFSPETITSADAARQLLDELGISENAFLSYLSSESLYNSYQKQNPFQEALNLLGTGKLLAYKVPLPPKTPPVKVIEFLPATEADKPVPLAPEASQERIKPLDGDKVFKRTHTDGDSKDPYTLQTDGKPLGASEGVMPATAKGLKMFPHEYNELIKLGFPDVVGREDYKNFSTIEPKELAPGTTIYRIVDEGSSEAGGKSGCYWAYSKPANKTEWRREYAVKDSWNDNGYYVEHTVGEAGLKVWEGKVAGQAYAEHEGKEFYLNGGETQ
ncbi:MAG TPA: hypothetical protein VF433_01230, partial [Cellvibrio sp.]